MNDVDYCRVCRVLTEVGPDGRCRSCVNAKAATDAGLHYGDYMAQKATGTIIPRTKPGIWRTCPRCGKEFVRHDKIPATYCGVVCQKAASYERRYERRKGK